MIRATFIVAALAFSTSASAVDGVAVEIGFGNENTETARAGVQWNWERRWFTERSWHLRGYWDLQLGRWSGPLRPGRRQQSVWDLGLTPVFRLERSTRTRVWPYFEAAIGFHLLSDVAIGPDRRFSTHFPFGDHIAAGWRFGDDNRYDMSLRLQHLSNGGIASPNPGINFLQLRLAYHFQ
jgi:lipid A 3-O-deacylase